VLEEVLGPNKSNLELEVACSFQHRLVEVEKAEKRHHWLMVAQDMCNEEWE
jgi:hypothetical protein